MLPFTTKPEQFRAVFDTNIIMAAHLTKNPRSPTRELLERWKMEEFELVYSTALLVEYCSGQIGEVTLIDHPLKKCH
ncbi:MAG: hypothetical protein H8D67_07925 [Deltaproteobacteria bacterium]|nr:hypothetical protein [Deltaproteobacteria bacterium]